MKKMLITFIISVLFTSTPSWSATTEIVKVHRGYAEVGDALCVQGFNEVPIVYRCDDPQSLRFFGIYAGKDGDGQPFAITEGDVEANICNKGYPLKKGDYLITSNYDGNLMRQSDNIQKMMTAAQLLQDVNFGFQGETKVSQRAMIRIVRYVQ